MKFIPLILPSICFEDFKSRRSWRSRKREQSARINKLSLNVRSIILRDIATSIWTSKCLKTKNLLESKFVIDYNRTLLEVWNRMCEIRNDKTFPITSIDLLINLKGVIRVLFIKLNKLQIKFFLDTLGLGFGLLKCHFHRKFFSKYFKTLKCKLCTRTILILFHTTSVWKSFLNVSIWNTLII